MEFAWTHVENAEWYGIELNYRIDTSGMGDYIYHDVYTYTYDTTYVVSDTILGYPTDRIYIYALPTTGPDPESGFGNWEGDFAAGKLYSVSYYAYARLEYENEPGMAKVIVDNEIEVPDKSPHDIIKAIYEAYK